MHPLQMHRVRVKFSLRRLTPAPIDRLPSLSTPFERMDRSERLPPIFTVGPPTFSSEPSNAHFVHRRSTLYRSRDHAHASESTPSLSEFGRNSLSSPLY